MNINLEYYKIFYFAAKLGGITAAAQELCISQPAVSQAVKQLESALNSRLFIRTSKGVKLTPEGKVLYSYVERGYEYIKVGETAFLKMLDCEAGEIRIGASDMTLRFYLLPFLEQFHEKFPKINIRVTNAPTPETLEHLSAGRIDFGIISSPITVKQGMKLYPGRKIEDVFIAGRQFRELKNRTVCFRELTDFPCILLEKNTSTRQHIDSFFEQQGITLKPEFELATSDIIVQFALRNLGVGCVVKEFAKEYLDSGELFQIYFDIKLPERGIYTIVHTQNPISSAAEKLLNLLGIDSLDKQ